MNDLTLYPIKVVPWMTGLAIGAWEKYDDTVMQNMVSLRKKLERFARVKDDVWDSND